MNGMNDFESTLGTDDDVSKKIKHIAFSCNKHLSLNIHSSTVQSCGTCTWLIIVFTISISIVGNFILTLAP